MPGTLSLVDSKGGSITKLDLPEVKLPPAEGQIAYGNPFVLAIKNTGSTRMREISIEVTGQGRVFVSLGTVRAWMKPGEALRFPGELAPRANLRFLARAVYRSIDDEDARSFLLVVRAVSVG